MCVRRRQLRGKSLLIFWSNPRLPLSFKALAVRSFLTPKYRVLLQLWAEDRVCSVLDCWLTLEPVLFSTARRILFLRARPCNGSPFTHCPLQSSLPVRNVSFRSKERWCWEWVRVRGKANLFMWELIFEYARESVHLYFSKGIASPRPDTVNCFPLFHLRQRQVVFNLIWLQSKGP